MAQLAGEAKDEEVTLWIAKVTVDADGEYLATVNGRATPRQALASTEFAFASQGQGSKVGEHVVLAASEHNDMAFIIGSSNYILG